MSRLDEIAVTVISPGQDSPGGGNAVAILHEIETMLAELLADGRGQSIDLRSLPMAPGDREILQDALGKGEVSASVDALGPSLVFETAIPGVWWVTHRNSNKEVMAEFIEVCHCPEILRTHPDDISDGLEKLRTRLTPHRKS